MSVLVQAIRPLTVEDLDTEVPEKFAEVIEGKLVLMSPAGDLHNWAAYNIQKLFDGFCTRRSDLTFGGDNDGFLIKRNPPTLLSPDASLHRRRPRLKTTWLEFAPEVVVEVSSPSNSAAEMLYKRNAFFAAGTEQFWFVDAEERQIEFYYPDGRKITVSGDETVSGEGIAEGLRISLAEIFRER